MITNVYLQGITGHEAMRLSKDHFPGLQVLMLSGLPDETAIQEWIGEMGSIRSRNRFRQAHS